MRISDWSSDVCSSDLPEGTRAGGPVDRAECAAGRLQYPAHRRLYRRLWAHRISDRGARVDGAGRDRADADLLAAAPPPIAALGDQFPLVRRAGGAGCGERWMRER